MGKTLGGAVSHCTAFITHPNAQLKSTLHKARKLGELSKTEKQRRLLPEWLTKLEGCVAFPVCFSKMVVDCIRAHSLRDCEKAVHMTDNAAFCNNSFKRCGLN